MRVAFLSDIHGNAVALEAVLADIRTKQADRIVVLGDIAFRGPEPKRAVDLVRSLDTTVVKGNVDEWTVRGVRDGEVPEVFLETLRMEREWALARLDGSDVDYLAALPEDVHVDLTDRLRIHAFHATPKSLFEVVWPHAEDDVIRDKLMADPQADIYVYAHIHLPYIRYVNGKCVVNIGSVGLPFDGLAHASYALIEGEGERFRVTIERVPYDVECVIRQYREAGYPESGLMERVVRHAVSPFALPKA